jgi:two-component system heavy metal sensor histidine kinase CusS
MNKLSLSLAARVMVFVGLAVGLSLVLIGSLVLSAVERHFSEQDAGELEVMNAAVVKALHNASKSPIPTHRSLSNAISGHHGVYFQVQNERGEIIYRTPGADLTYAAESFIPSESIHATSVQMWQEGDSIYRGVVTQAELMGRSYLITTAIDMDFHLEFLKSFRLSLWFIMSLAGTITMLAAWYGVYQAHAPLRGLSSKVEGIQADQLHVRLDSSAVPMELKGLVASFNHMIGKLEDSFSRLSHFSADIAHELRTPLTNLITQTQVGLSKARALEEYRELLYSNLEEQERLAKMVSDMLWLAKSDHGLIKPKQTPLNLTHEIDKLFDFFEALAEDRQVSLILEGEAATILGDRAMLRQAISNLLSNAIRHTAPKGSVTITLAELSDRKVSVAVKNPGPGIPAVHLPRIFDRFYRADPSRVRQNEGAGLGLAIVKSITEAHGGRAEVFSSQGATTFMLTLPC